MGQGTIPPPVDSGESAPWPSAASFWAMADLMPEIVWISDRDGKAEFVNRRWFEVTGLTPEETLRPDGWLLAVHPDDVPRTQMAWRQALDRNTGYEITVRLRDRTGATARWFLCRGTPTRDASGQLQGWVGTCADVDALRRSVDRANRELDDFCYSVSHDLRTPLRAIEGFSQAVAEEEGANLSSEGMGYLERIRRATLRMDGLITSLLTLARMSRADVVTTPVDLSLRCRQIAEHIVDKRVDLTIEEGLTASADQRLIDLLLENLLSNAAKFSSGAPQPRIEFGRQRHARGMAFFVRDNGTGFDPRHESHLFKPFEKLHSARDEGHGIGLAIVHKIVAKHGGQVWAEAVEGAGATFWFTLPGS